MSSEQYFANKEGSDLNKALHNKLSDYRKFLRTSGILDELRRSYRLYYGNSAIQNVGSSKVGMQVNHYRNLLAHIHTMITSQRPAFDARAVNSDYETQGATQLANSLLDYYLREKRLEDHLKNATELCLFLREGWIAVNWNVTGGEVYAVNPENGQPIHEGDVEFKTHSLVEVARDVNNKTNAQDWYVVCETKNKWDLIAKYPDLKERILAIGSNREYIIDELNLSYSVSSEATETDQINFYTFFHRKSESVPTGKMVQFLDGDITLFEGPLPYKEVYLYRIAAATGFQTAFGHSPGMDIMPLQDALDSTFSTILTNHNAFGVQNIMAPKGSGISVQQVSEGMNLIEYGSPGPPAPLNLVQTPPEIFNFANMLISQSETISGVNSVARGNAPASLSGSALALIQSQALNFSSGLGQSYNALLENVGSALIELLQTFAAVPRIATIAGKTKKPLLKEFKNSDLEGVSRVIVDSANPLTKTTAGRTQIADNLMQSGLIKTPEQYVSVITTGNLEPLYEHENSQNLLIRQENEWLSEGKTTSAVMTDDHSLHVLEHSVVLASPESRQNPQVVTNVLNHIQEHINLAKSIDPVLAQMLKLPQLQLPAPAAPQPQGIGEVQDNQMPITQQAEAVAMPSMPNNALTGQPNQQ